MAWAQIMVDISGILWLRSNIYRVLLIYTNIIETSIVSFRRVFQAGRNFTSIQCERFTARAPTLCNANIRIGFAKKESGMIKEGGLMKKRIICLVSVIVFVGAPLLSQAQSGIAVVKAFKRVETAIKTSDNRAVFMNFLKDATTEADVYFLSDEARKNPQFTDQIKIVYRDYIWAVNFGELKQSGIVSVHANDPVMKIIYEEFPEAKQFLKGTIQLDEAIIFFYDQAEKEMMLAMKYLRIKDSNNVLQQQ